MSTTWSQRHSRHSSWRSRVRCGVRFIRGGIDLARSILADEANALRKGFGVPSDMFGFLPGRQTYVISKEGKVVLVFNSQLDVEAHVERAMAALRKLQTAKSS